MSFTAAYQQGKLADFFDLAPFDTDSALEISRPIHRPILVNALERYALTLDAPKATFKALEQLKHPESRAVVTGQQAGLLLGPNYTLSKAITAIKLAHQLSTEKRPVVPIFWVASQDHDAEEVNHAYLLDMQEHLHRLELALPAGLPIGKINMQGAWLEQITQKIETLPFPKLNISETLNLLHAAASKAQSFADWFAALLYKLLGHQGLIIINPLEADIAPRFEPILKTEIEQPLSSSLSINQAGQYLERMGYEPQLKRAAQATNLFIEENAQRHLLRFEADTFSTELQSYSASDLKAILKNDPTRITPAAGLRPITQDYTLPTAITVLGPGELRYFAQLKGVYKLHSVPMSLAWSRPTATLLEPPVVRILEKYQLDIHALIKDFQRQKEKTLFELHGYAQDFTIAHHTLETSMQVMLENLKAIDPTLQGTLQRSEKHIRKSLELLKAKTAQALVNKDTITAQQFDRLEKHLLPLAIPQERLISPFSFFLKFGIDAVMTRLNQLPVQDDHFLAL